MKEALSYPFKTNTNIYKYVKTKHYTTLQDKSGRHKVYVNTVIRFRCESLGAVGSKYICEYLTYTTPKDPQSAYHIYHA